MYRRYDGSLRNLVVYVIPTRPGWSRLLATFLHDTNKPSSLPWPVLALFGAIESVPWLEHVTQRNLVLDGDTFFLHQQVPACLPACVPARPCQPHAMPTASTPTPRPSDADNAVVQPSCRLAVLQRPSAHD